MGSIVARPYPSSIDSPSQPGEIVQFPTRNVRDEDEVSYDGQTKAERQGGKHYTRLDDDVLDTIIERHGHEHLGIYTYLERKVNAAGRWKASYSRMLDDLPIRKSTLIGILGDLERLGVIKITRDPDAQRTHTPNVYFLPFHRQSTAEASTEAGSACDQASTEASTEAGRMRNTVSNYSNESNYTRREAPANVPLDDASNERLQTFRQAYPAKRRSGNSRALAQEWAPLTIAEQEAAIASLSVFTQSEEWQANGGRYIPNILRFLNERRWESVPAADAPSLRPTDYGFYGSTGLEQFRTAVRNGKIPGVTPAMVEARS